MAIYEFRSIRIRMDKLNLFLLTFLISLVLALPLFYGSTTETAFAHFGALLLGVVFSCKLKDPVKDFKA